MAHDLVLTRDLGITEAQARQLGEQASRGLEGQKRSMDKLRNLGSRMGITDMDVYRLVVDGFNFLENCGRNHGWGGDNAALNPWQAQSASWKPPIGACPPEFWHWLVWLWRSQCSYNRFGHIGTAELQTNVLALPDANPAIGFRLDPATQPLGVDFPLVWSGEAAGMGIERLKVNFLVSGLVPGAPPGLALDQVIAGLFGLKFRIIQSGSQDLFHTALDVGQAADAQNSNFVPSLGGYFLKPGYEFVIWAFQPDIQSFDFSGLAPGLFGTDSYNVQGNVTTYFKWLEIKDLLSGRMAYGPQYIR